MEKIKKLITEHWNVLIYLFFGALTTLVNFLVYFPLYNWVQWPAVVSNAVAWVVAVAFAFLTNKPFVFQSYDWSLHVLLPEFSKFVACRLVSGLLETAVIWLCVDVLKWNGNLLKTIVSILVVILNYVFSKRIVFKRKGKC